MAPSCDISGVVMLLLALGSMSNANVSCRDKATVTCSAGTFYRTASCKCEDCPVNTYSSIKDSRPKSCTRCKQCEEIFQYKERCSRTQDAVCECKAGFRCVGEGCRVCYKNCGAGEEPTEKGCQKCPQQTFNNETNGPCKPWTNCLSQGLDVLMPGTNISDTVCSSPDPVAGVAGEQAVAYHVIIAVSLFLFMCVAGLSMAMVSWVKKKVKNGFKPIPPQVEKIAEVEDACSCHLPEEEQGDTVTQEA
ncbi:tumor necrosis factor receptor superfamily member 9 [Ambystoma mexicanum]|uniref:tumor necrosis factor receptor superfamily member 9 n=1 Tax=Ambystoma mexicanum TaxID=8296 RepID=UPI0037E81937